MAHNLGVIHQFLIFFHIYLKPLRSQSDHCIENSSIRMNLVMYT